MKFVLACACLAGLWASPMDESGLAMAADLIAIVGAGTWLYLMGEPR